MRHWLDEFLKDSGFAIRQLRKAPGFTAVAVLSLALGIGANTAIFTLIESTLLRPIPAKHAEQLRLLTWLGRGGGWVAPNLGYMSPTFGSIYEQRETEGGGLIHTDFSPGVYREFRRQNTMFETMFTFKELGRVTAVSEESAEPANVFLVSEDFYRGMDVSPVIGRPIGRDDALVALISYEYWTRRFARSPSVLGKTITLNEVPVTIIGVNPEYFTGVVPGAHFEIWAPLSLPATVGGRSFLEEEKAWSLPVMGRLKPGVSDAQAQSAFDLIFQQQVDAVDYLPAQIRNMLKDPAKRPSLSVVSGARGIDYLTQRYDRLLFAVLSLAALVLLIACTNVANLLLAKSAIRQREISLRLALGAGRWRIVRQLLTEGLPLALLAGAGGLLFAYWTRNGIPALLATPWRPSPFETAFDFKVLLASFSLTFLTGLLFSLAPVWQARGVEVNEALNDGSRGTASLSKLHIGRLLVVFQVALSVVLLVGAGLSVKTFTNLKNASLGFKPEGVMLFALDPPRLRYPAERMGALLTEIQEKIGALPGVASATFTGNGRGIVVNPRDAKPGVNNYAPGDEVGSRFFETMRIPIVYGRAIDEHDRGPGLRAAVVNREFGRFFFGQENAVGKTFKTYDDVTFQIVGVSDNWRAERFRDPIRASVYTALVQAPHAGRATFEVRIAGDPGRVVEEIRRSLRSVDPDLAIADVHTEVEQIQNGLSQERLMASLAAVFGVLALILASIGIYGVMAYTVARRTNEIGIRVALGARPSGVSWMVLRETLALAVAGVALGVPAVMALSPVLDHVLASDYNKSFTYGMNPNDPFTIGLAVLTLAAVGFLAGYLPAQRAARVDPMTALRHE